MDEQLMIAMHRSCNVCRHLIILSFINMQKLIDNYGEFDNRMGALLEIIALNGALYAYVSGEEIEYAERIIPASMMILGTAIENEEIEDEIGMMTGITEILGSDLTKYRLFLVAPSDNELDASNSNEYMVRRYEEFRSDIILCWNLYNSELINIKTKIAGYFSIKLAQMLYNHSLIDYLWIQENMDKMADLIKQQKLIDRSSGIFY